MKKSLNSVYLFAVTAYTAFASRILLLYGGKATLAFTLDVIGWAAVVVLVLTLIGSIFSETGITPKTPITPVSKSAPPVVGKVFNIAEYQPAANESIN